MAAGLEQALDFIEGLRFGEEELDWIERSELFRPGFADRRGADPRDARAEPDPLRHGCRVEGRALLAAADPYPVEIAPALRALAEEVDNHVR